MLSVALVPVTMVMCTVIVTTHFVVKGSEVIIDSIKEQPIQGMTFKKFYTK